ncbi:ASCH domain-containing protein [Lactobacillus crispatus]|uniref:ASCH domain-containing protein n=1 Tax=Lactobacillus crispatus TaxID=47770 RepID=UPI0018E3224F|nr:ASCH domain-containing protein [Lactobacillus crispatus]MBI1695135.1 ASCH domain-containing protein [Lactobacillus crispatus]
MKALSVRGDYVMDMITGKKKIEYRTWSTKYRGPLLMCSTTKKVAGAAPGYAVCVVNLKDIEWSDFDEEFHWNIELRDLIEPVPVKGQLKLFNVDDSMITPIKDKKAWETKIKPLIYTPKRKRKRKNSDGPNFSKFKAYHIVK